MFRDNLGKYSYFIMKTYASRQFWWVHKSYNYFVADQKDIIKFYQFASWSGITKLYLYNFDPLKPHFYMVKLGFTGVDIIFSYFCSKT